MLSSWLDSDYIVEKKWITRINGFVYFSAMLPMKSQRKHFIVYIYILKIDYVIWYEQMGIIDQSLAPNRRAIEDPKEVPIIDFF